MNLRRGGISGGQTGFQSRPCADRELRGDAVREPGGKYCPAGGSLEAGHFSGRQSTAPELSSELAGRLGRAAGEDSLRRSPSTGTGLPLAPLSAGFLSTSGRQHLDVHEGRAAVSNKVVTFGGRVLVVYPGGRHFRSAGRRPNEFPATRAADAGGGPGIE
jgi:hypothetical protein